MPDERLLRAVARGEVRERQAGTVRLHDDVAPVGEVQSVDAPAARVEEQVVIDRGAEMLEAPRVDRVGDRIGLFVPNAMRSSGSAAPPQSAICAAITWPSPAARDGSVTGFRGSLAYRSGRGRCPRPGARRRAEAITRPVPPPSANATRARTADGASVDGNWDRNHDATSPIPPPP